VKREILDHADHILSREATRTLSARVLHERTTGELRVELGYAQFLEALGSQPERFIIVTERPPFRDGPPIADADQLATFLEHTGVLRCATVALTAAPSPDESGCAAADEVFAALAGILADAHAAVVDLLRAEKADPVSTAGSLGVLELEELRRLCSGLKAGDCGNCNSISSNYD
jgi:hypothetical protein